MLSLSTRADINVIFYACGVYLSVVVDAHDFDWIKIWTQKNKQQISTH